MLILFLFIIGAAMGSFAYATTWRLKNERNFTSERSECEYCHHMLAAKDLVPILSWLWLKGKCRYCSAKIGIGHIIVEITLGLLFVISYWLWPSNITTVADWVNFGFWLIYLVFIAILFIYDLKWKLLPDKIVFPLIAIGALGTVTICLLQQQNWHLLLNAAEGVGVFAGFLGLLYLVSGGRWIGLGDVKLAIFMGLVLGMPNAVLGLIGSFYVGAIVTAPLLFAKKLNAKSQVPFGPFLLTSFTLVFFFGHSVVHFVTHFGL